MTRRASRRFVALFWLAAWAVTALGCGGSADLTQPPGGVSIAADFVPDVMSPGAGSVTLQKRSAVSNLVTIEVSVTDLEGIFAATFDLVYDPTLARYVTAEEGDLLDGDGAATSFLVTEAPGRLVVGLTRLQNGSGDVPDVAATGSASLVTFTFRVLRADTGTIDFDGGSPRAITDRDGVPRPASWGGGTLVGR